MSSDAAADGTNVNPDKPTNAFLDWLSVIGAFVLYYAFLAGFTAALFAIALQVIFDGGDPRASCPFEDLPLTNCHSLCAGPPQLFGAWRAAAEGSAERERAALAINEWIAGRNVFLWNSTATNDTTTEFDGLPVTNDFYRRVGCCKLLDGTPLTKENVANRELWDEAFNNDDAEATGVTCSTFTNPST